MKPRLVFSKLKRTTLYIIITFDIFWRSVPRIDRFLPSHYYHYSSTQTNLYRSSRYPIFVRLLSRRNYTWLSQVLCRTEKQDDTTLPDKRIKSNKRKKKKVFHALWMWPVIGFGQVRVCCGDDLLSGTRSCGIFSWGPRGVVTLNLPSSNLHYLKITPPLNQKIFRRWLGRKPSPGNSCTTLKRKRKKEKGNNVWRRMLILETVKAHSYLYKKKLYEITSWSWWLQFTIKYIFMSHSNNNKISQHVSKYMLYSL